MANKKYKTFDSFVENYSLRYPAPIAPKYWKQWFGADLIIHFMPAMAALLLSGWGTYKVTTLSRSVPVWAAFTAVFVFEASLAVAAKSLGLGKGWAMKLILWIILGITALVTMLTNSLDAMSSLGVTFNSQLFSWLQVIALGFFVPVLGILHIPPLSAQFRAVAESLELLKSNYQDEYDEWLEGVWATYEKYMAQDDSNISRTSQRVNKVTRQEGIAMALDEYLDEAYSGDISNFSLPQSFVMEQADFYGVREYVIQRDIRDWLHEQSQKTSSF